jgi:hypothetical protein
MAYAAIDYQNKPYLTNNFSQQNRIVLHSLTHIAGLTLTCLASISTFHQSSLDRATLRINNIRAIIIKTILTGTPLDAQGKQISVAVPILYAAIQSLFLQVSDGGIKKKRVPYNSIPPC